MPLFFEPKYRNSSLRGTVFGDTLRELDGLIENVWNSVKETGQEDNTMFILSADK